MSALRRKRYIAVFGSRTAKLADVENAIKSVKLSPQNHIIVSGGAKGADTHARTIAERDGFEYIEVPAFWSRGKGAGMARNSTIVNIADAGVGVWDSKSAGTKDTISKFELAKKKCEVFAALEGMSGGGDNE